MKSSIICETIKYISKLCKCDKQSLEPDRQNVNEEPAPKIINVDCKVKTQGKYKTKSGNPIGLVVHYTVSGRSPERTKKGLIDLASRGLGCLYMDENGQIYKAKNQELDDVAWHAGTSEWKGKKGLSQYCMGIEIACYGKLKDAEHDAYGQKVDASEIRSVSKIDNIKAGYYQKYTEAQEKSLINFILWQARTNPEFDIDWLVGHDEIAPNRKSDPGGSLSMSMPALRKKIKEML